MTCCGAAPVRALNVDEVKVFGRALSPDEIHLGYLISRYLPFWAASDLIL